MNAHPFDVSYRGDERKIRNELFEALEIADESDKGRV